MADRGAVGDLRNERRSVAVVSLDGQKMTASKAVSSWLTSVQN
jgi:hypothetical protein